MNVVILYTPAGPDAPPEDTDGLIQMEVVKTALNDLGHRPIPLGLTLNLAEMKKQIEAIRPDCVFNLVEAVDNRDALIFLAPALLEALAIPFTGCGQTAMMLSTCKLAAKRLMRAAGIPTPDWWDLSGQSPMPPKRGDPIILKSAWDHGSIRMLDSHVTIMRGRTELEKRLRALEERPGDNWFAEKYVDGREISVAALAGAEGPEMLPPWEILFMDYADDKPKVVGYKSKWVDKSFEWDHTPRTFEFKADDAPILERLRNTTLACWRLFGMRGYARVDFRVDADNNPWVLEVNANPCLSPDAGFYSALERAGLQFTEAVDRLLTDALKAKPPTARRKSERNECPLQGHRQEV